MKIHKLQLTVCLSLFMALLILITMIIPFKTVNWGNNHDTTTEKESNLYKRPYYSNKKDIQVSKLKLPDQTSLFSKNYNIDNIGIDNNDGFISHGFPGSGTNNDPFIISGYAITNINNPNPLISIQNTDVYFIIQDNQLFGVSKSYPGIFLHNVKYGKIINNTITGSQDGITLDSSSLITISNNRISHNSWAGIWLTSDSHTNSLSNNFLFKNWNGIKLGSDSSSSNDNIIVNNSFYSNTYSGISIRSSINNILYYNNVHDNRIGIDLVSSNHFTIIRNTVQNNEKWGIQVSSNSHDNSIEQNNFINNSQYYSISQAIDSGTNNVFLNNYWNDWTSPDIDNDGIVDDPYPIEGSSSNKDLFPLVTNIVMTSDEIFIRIVIPTDGDILIGTITVKWIIASISNTNSVTYSLYYSIKENGSWILLDSNLTTNTYNWNTLTVTDNSNYRIKLVVTYSNGSNISVISEGTFTIQNSYVVISTLILPIFIALLTIGVLIVLNKQIMSIITKIEDNG